MRDPFKTIVEKAIEALDEKRIGKFNAGELVYQLRTSSYTKEISYNSPMLENKLAVYNYLNNEENKINHLFCITPPQNFIAEYNCYGVYNQYLFVVDIWIYTQNRAIEGLFINVYDKHGQQVEANLSTILNMLNGVIK